jgi:type IV pilus assembly protein PilO
MQGFHLMKFTILKQIMIMRKKTLYAVVTLFVAALSSQLFINLYQNPRVEKLQTEWIKLREQEGRGALLQDRETLYKNGISDLARFRERVYPKSQFARYIGDLYDLGAKNSLEIDSITYKPLLNKDDKSLLKKDDKMLSYALSLTVSGRYPQLKKFIYDLGSNGNIQVINSISMVAANTPASAAVQLQLQMTSYFNLEAR